MCDESIYVLFTSLAATIMGIMEASHTTIFSCITVIAPEDYRRYFGYLRTEGVGQIDDLSAKAEGSNYCSLAATPRLFRM